MRSAQRQFDNIMEATRERIRRDGCKTSEQVRPVLEYLEEHIFDHDLDVNALRRACDVRDNSLSLYFQTAVQRTPHAYIEDCRLEAAGRLLRETDLKIWQIAQRVGYSTLQVFSRAFARREGQRPSRYRDANGDQQTATTKTRKTPNARTAAKTPTTVKTSGQALLEKALRGELDGEAAKRLLGRLAAIYPQAAPQPVAPPATALALARAEELRAVEMWELLRSLPLDAASEKVRRAVFETPALFDLLRTKSREEGRMDRRRGLEIAEMAVAGAAALSAKPKGVEAQAWACLGNARRLLLDLDGAERAFDAANDAIPDAPLQVRCEVFHLHASLRWYQRRLAEALDLESRAIEGLRKIGSPRQLAEALILRAILHDAASAPEAGIPDLQKALALLEENPGMHTFLRLSACHSLASNYASAGKYQEAAALMPKIEKLCAATDQKLFWLHFRWLEGVVAQGLGRLEAAEISLLAARRGYFEIDDRGHAAVVALDLSCLYLEQGRAEEVLPLATEMFLYFETLNIPQESMAGLAVLKQAIAQQRMTRAAFDKVRHTVQQLRRNPNVPL